MTPHEYNSLGPDNENDIDLSELPPEVDVDQLPVTTAAELDIVRRRELVVQATDALEEVLGEHVTLPGLMREAHASQPATFTRLQARRALRCIKDIGEEESAVVEAVGEGELYHYVEGVLQYGASKKTYLGLMELGLSAEETTGLYALRQLIIDDESGASFGAIRHAIQLVGMTLQEAIENPDEAVAAFVEAGFFVNYSGSRTFDHAIFSPELPASERQLGSHWDSIRPSHSSVSMDDEVDPAAWAQVYLDTVGTTTDEDTQS